MNAFENPKQGKFVIVSLTTFGACMLVYIKGALYTENSHIDFMCLKLKSTTLEYFEIFVHLTSLEKKSDYLGYTFQVLLYCRRKF